MIELSKIWATLPGALIILSTMIFAGFLIVVLSPGLRRGFAKFLNERSLRASVGKASIDFTPTAAASSVESKEKQIKPVEQSSSAEDSRIEASSKAAESDSPKSEDELFLACLMWHISSEMYPRWKKPTKHFAIFLKERFRPNVLKHYG
jgi:hypothetical protein